MMDDESKPDSDARKAFYKVMVENGLCARELPITCKVIFDHAHAQGLFDELRSRLKAWDVLESIPSHIREDLDECLAGRGFEFADATLGAASDAGERIIKIQLAGGRLHSALAALRALQGDVAFGVVHGASV